MACKRGKTPNAILLSEYENVTLEDQQFEEETGLISTIKKVQWREERLL